MLGTVGAAAAAEVEAAEVEAAEVEAAEVEVTEAPEEAMDAESGTGEEIRSAWAPVAVGAAAGAIAAARPAPAAPTSTRRLLAGGVGACGGLLMGAGVYNVSVLVLYILYCSIGSRSVGTGTGL